MQSRCLWVLVPLWLLIPPDLNAGASVDDVAALIAKATQARDPIAWARYLIQADQAAERLESDKPAGCCGYRCLRVGSFELHFRYNEIQGTENYQHDLLQLVAQAHEGTSEGAEALVRLLPTGCQTIASTWTPFFKTLIGILELRSWRSLADPRLTKIRAEAYETWWSLSRARDDDPVIADQGLKAEDFRDGAAQARARAIEAYQEFLRLGKADPEIAERLQKLKSGQDTDQRDWFCAGD